MLWKVRVLDQVLFAQCISKKKLRDYLENDMGIADAIVEIKALSCGEIKPETLAPEILVNLNRSSLYSTGLSTRM